MKRILSLTGIVLVLLALTVGLIGCVSPTAFKIHITSPKNNTDVTESPLTVTGNVTGYTRGEVVYGDQQQTMRLAPEVTVNGFRAEVAEDGTYSVQVPLTSGKNTITAIAMFNNLTVKDHIKVNYTQPVPDLTVAISSPADGAELSESPATVTGTVSDADSLVEVNGEEVEVDENGNFSTQVELVEGENVLTAEATLGKQTAEDSVTVNYTVPEPALAVEITSPQDGAALTESPIAVSGTVTAAEATVKVNGIDAEVAEDGTYTAQIELVEGENVITAIATLNEKTAQDSITVTYSQPVPPLTLSITTPEDGAQLTQSPAVVVGKVSDITATVKVEGVEVEPDENGNFSTTVALIEGQNIIQAVATQGEETAEDSVTVTYTEPTPILSIEITSPADGTVSSNDSATITGTVSIPAATVKVNDVEAEVAENGTYTAQVTLVEGENTISAVATSGDLESTDSITIIYTPPAPPLSVEITAPVDAAELTESPVTVTGTVNYATATLKVNDIEVAVAEDGTFSTQLALTEGENVITASATLDEETAEDSVTVTYTIPLIIEITSPEDGAVSTTNSATVTGTVSIATATVKVNGTDVTVAEDGTFSTQVTLIKGENTIEAAATSGEKQASDSIKVTYAGPALSLEVTTNPLNVTGKVSDPAAKVTVNEVEALVAEDGTFSAQVILVPGLNTITVIATLDGEQTSYSFTVTYNPPAPAALTLAITSPEEGAALTESPVTVTGTVSEAAASVTVNGVQAVVADDGTFSAQVELAEGENTITATAVAGDTQTEASVTVTLTTEATE